MSPSLPTPSAFPSPAKKRISLSDWSKRKKVAQEAAAQQQASQSSPLATSEPLSAKGIPEEPSTASGDKENHTVIDKGILTGKPVEDEPMQVDDKIEQPPMEMEVDAKEPANAKT
jgi:hypothetical protein